MNLPSDFISKLTIYMLVLVFSISTTTADLISDPETLVSECTFPVSVNCVNFSVTQSSIQLIMLNGAGRDMRITRVSASSEALGTGSLGVGCSTGAITTTLRNGATVSFTLSTGDVAGACNFRDTGRDKNRYNVSVYYNWLDSSSITHVLPGELIVDKLGNKEVLNTFFMTKEEADPESIDEAFIIYLADCKASDVGKLSVAINGKLISSKVPNCGSLEKKFIDPTDFVAGKNELKFSTEAGKYLIDQIFVKTKLKKPVSPEMPLRESEFEYNIPSFTLAASEEKSNDSKVLNEPNRSDEKVPILAEDINIINKSEIVKETTPKQLGSKIFYGIIIVFVVAVILAVFLIKQRKKAPFEERTCPNCKANLKKSDLYCQECGEKIRG